ncbi:unnamed protein product [marine sediment metagenome]|uniref:Uncharacterized protein n=1 Tax=marine sediment metagenome TaxID=412755 RepID=X0S7U1_9ZZZZ
MGYHEFPRAPGGVFPWPIPPAWDDNKWGSKTTVSEGCHHHWSDMEMQRCKASHTAD